MKYNKIWLILFYFFFNTVMYGQDTISTKPNNLFWGSVGHGLLGVGFSGNYLRNKNLFTARYSGYFLTFDNVYDEYSILYGRTIINKNYILFSTSLGLGLINIYNIGILEPSRIIEKNLFNFPIETQVILIPYKFIGIGFKAFANLNSHDASGWGLITLQFGKLR